jgi:DNA-binding MarR family transcriptional regulator
MGSFIRKPGSLSFLVRSVWLTMRASINAELKAFGLSTPQYATLMILEEKPGLSNADIARSVSSTRQSANELLGNLERDGLVERRPHLSDRRAQQVFLTGLGARRLDDARMAVQRREAELEAAFTTEQRTAARAWLEGIAEACGRQAGD